MSCHFLNLLICAENISKKHWNLSHESLFSDSKDMEWLCFEHDMNYHSFYSFHWHNYFLQCVQCGPISWLVPSLWHKYIFRWIFRFISVSESRILQETKCGPIKKCKQLFEYQILFLLRDICGLYYKSFTIVICNHIDSGQYYKSTITLIIYKHGLF